MNHNLNRQMSSPVQSAFNRTESTVEQRKTSLPVPPRPSTASPTTPNRPFQPIFATHLESNSSLNKPARPTHLFRRNMSTTSNVTQAQPPYIDGMSWCRFVAFILWPFGCCLFFWSLPSFLCARMRLKRESHHSMASLHHVILLFAFSSARCCKRA